MKATSTDTQPLWFVNQLVEMRIEHAEGRDGIAVLESRAAHGASPPLHVHHTEDEALYVLEGELRLRVGEAELRLGAGQGAVAPLGVPHTYRVESAAGARWVNVTTHGDFVRFVRAVSRPAERSEPPPATPPAPEQAGALAAAGRAHGVEFVGPPLDA
jgi:quercetin dioxygenase-like cupin family protein